MARHCHAPTIEKRGPASKNPFDNPQEAFLKQEGGGSQVPAWCPGSEPPPPPHGGQTSRTRMPQPRFTGAPIHNGLTFLQIYIPRPKLAVLTITAPSGHQARRRGSPQGQNGTFPPWANKLLAHEDGETMRTGHATC